MRVKNFLRNSIYAAVSYSFIAVISLLVRRCFVKFLSIDLLGYEGLFGNIFAIFSLADLGMESFITYRLYPAFSNKDYESISRLMSVYKWIYKVVGSFISIIGILIIPFLKYIISDNRFPWNYVYLVYMFQLVTMLCTYFLAYKRIIFIVDQRESEIIKIDSSCSIVMNITRIMILIVFRNYIAYLATNVISNICTNTIISKKIKQSYPQIKTNQKVGLKDIQSLGIDKDIRNGFLSRIASTIYGGTDSIIISAFLGIEKVGLLNNYILVYSYTGTFIKKIIHPFQAAIGNYVYSTESVEGMKMFRMFDVVSFFMGSFFSISYAVLFNPFITGWLGKKFLLDEGFVIMFSINQFITWNHYFVFLYRSCFGKYELDRNYYVCSAIINVLMSVWLVKLFGVAGVLSATVMANIMIWIGRVRVVYTEYMKEDISKYIFRQLKRCVLYGAELYITWIVAELYCKNDLWGFIQRIGCCVVIPNVINILMFSRTMEMKYIQTYIAEIWNIAKLNRARN